MLWVIIQDTLKINVSMEIWTLSVGKNRIIQKNIPIIIMIKSIKQKL